MTYLTLVQEKVIKTKWNHWLNKYKCICGNDVFASKRNVESGHTKSCGCYRKSLKTAFKHGLIRHPLYHVWNNMLRRCYDETNKKYKDYGERGVIVCEEWKNDFKKYYDWCIANGWKIGIEIDKDIKGNGLLYSPEMCLIVTHKENSNSRRNSRYINYNGETKTIAQWADLYNIHPRTLRHRIVNGWDLSDALTFPQKKHGGHNRYVRSIKYSFGYIN